MIQGYCVKCKKKTDMKKLSKKLVGGKMQVKGVCSKCGTNMCTFTKK